MCFTAASVISRRQVNLSSSFVRAHDFGDVELELST